MRYAVLFLLLPFLSFSQTGKWPSGRLQPVFQTGGSAPSFQFQALFWNEANPSIDTTGLSNARLVVHTDGQCVTLLVTVLNSPSSLESGQVISGIATDTSGLLSALPTGMGALYLDLPNSAVPRIPYLTEELQSCLITQGLLSLEAGGSTSITAGANITVTGTGESGDPYIVTGIGGSGMDSDSIVAVTYASDTLVIELASGQEFKAAIAAGSTTFDSNRQILRTPTVGTTIGGTTVNQWLEWWYFTAPTISLAQAPATPTVIEVGTLQTYEYNSTTTNTGGATLSNGEIFRVSPANTFLNFGAATSGGPVTISYGPNQAQSGQAGGHFYQFRATQDWAFGAESGTATSNTRTIQAVYPVLYGMAADTATVFGNAYGTLTKLVETEGNKTVSLTGSGLIFYASPASWTDTNLSSIIDPNGFNVTASFTRIATRNVSSTGLTNNWTNVPYVFYFLNTGATTTSASNYTFNR